MTFARPELLWLLLATPLLAALLAWLWRRHLLAMRAWSDPKLWPGQRSNDPRVRMALATALLSVAVAAVTLALAQPRWGLREETVERRGVDVVFAVDTSLSMVAEDVPPNRLWIARQIVRTMIDQLPGSRVGLIQFEGAPEVRSPLTLDREMVELLVGSLETATLTEPGTAFAPALRVAARLFSGAGDTHRVVVLVSDGEDHEGGWERLIDLLRQERIVVHTVGVGTRRGAPLPRPGNGGRRYRELPEGGLVISRLEERTLETLAGETGGRHLVVSGSRFDVTPLLAEIRAPATGTIEEESLILHAERFQLPLGLGALGLALYLASLGGRRRQP